ncbi:hypothetical protein DNH61_12830 [Paenibacillus sambharensis]|uniref:Uncharacterized protein n=1 Tax=Paenibacillus sambharensis TaxID=1803190 RepID=A0A2W1LKK3_9BACL|nr:hypothetical protein [Paenibacillus sambharensis]PZD95415.1 hypothetical protein DNH61_12830 [Paenibacillus sambharensis]
MTARSTGGSLLIRTDRIKVYCSAWTNWSRAGYDELCSERRTQWYVTGDVPSGLTRQASNDRGIDIIIGTEIAVKRTADAAE